jgi:hypothetical protein
MVDLKNIPCPCPAWYFLCYTIFSAVSVFALGMIALLEKNKYDKVNGDVLYSPKGMELRAKNAGLGAAIYGGVGVLCLACWGYAAFIKRPQ